MAPKPTLKASRVERAVRGHIGKMRISKDARAYITGVLDYVAAEIVKDTVAETEVRGKKRVTMKDFLSMADKNADIFSSVPEMTFAGAGIAASSSGNTRYTAVGGIAPFKHAEKRVIHELQALRPKIEKLKKRAAKK